MKETGNVFDASTTLMEIEDLPEGEPDARHEDRAASEGEAEPDYFNPPAPAKGGQARRRAIGALSVVGGMVFTAVLISAATGMGESKPSTPPPSEAPREPTSAPVVEKQPATAVRTRPAPRRRSNAKTAAMKERARDEHRREKAKAAPRRRHRHAHSPSKAAAPPPEPTYTPEPETTYVPTETAPPVETPPPAPAGGSQGEFGFEP